MTKYKFICARKKEAEALFEFLDKYLKKELLIEGGIEADKKTVYFEVKE